MQALAKAAAGKSYTIKWMFGIPEVLDKIRKCKIDEGSEITVIQNSGRDTKERTGKCRQDHVLSGCQMRQTSGVDQ